MYTLHLCCKKCKVCSGKTKKKKCADKTREEFEIQRRTITISIDGWSERNFENKGFS